MMVLSPRHLESPGGSALSPTSSFSDQALEKRPRRVPAWLVRLCMALFASLMFSASAFAACGYATAGTYSKTLCWLDITAYNEAAARSAGGQAMSIGLQGGYTLNFTIKHVSNGPSNRDYIAVTMPTYSAAELGNTAYPNIPGKAALYQTGNADNNPADDTVTLSGITLTNSTGVPMNGWSMVIADSESIGFTATNNAEANSYTTNGGAWNALKNTGTCNNSASAWVGIGTATVSCLPDRAGSFAAFIGMTQQPSTVTVNMQSIGTNRGLSGTAFAIVTASVTLNKTISPGRVNAGDQFTLSGTDSSNVSIGSATTAGAALTASTGPMAVPVAGATYTFREVAAGSTVMSNYRSTVSCVNANASATALPSGSLTSFTLTPALDDIITCTFTNTAPSVKLAKTSIGGIGPFGFTLGGVSGPSETISTLTSGSTVTSTTSHVGPVGAAVTITENAVAGYTTAVSCIDANSAITGNTVAITSNTTTVNIPTGNMQAGAAYTCTFTNTKNPTLSLQKAMGGSGRVAPTDQFTLSGTGPGAPAAQVTTGSGTAVTSPAYAFTGTVGAAYTLNEAMAAGSASTLGFYNQAVACTNTGSTVVSGFTTLPINVTPVAGDAISCTVTNSPKTTTFQLVKAWGASSGVSDTVTIGATSGGSANTAAFNAAGGTAANSGAPVTVTVGNTIVLPAETFAPAASAANYVSTLACTAAGGPTANTLSGTSGQASNTLQIGLADAGKAIVCTYTNSRRIANLSIVKTANPTNVQTGGTVVFTLTVNNAGPAAANGAILRDKPGTGLLCTATPTCVASGGAACPSAAALTASTITSNAGVPIPTLPAGGQVVVTLTCTATASGQ